MKAEELLKKTQMSESVASIPKELNRKQIEKCSAEGECTNCNYKGKPMGKVCPDCGTQIVK